MSTNGTDNTNNTDGTSGTKLSNDRQVVYLASGYLNASNFVNATFQNGYLSSQFHYFDNASSPFDWLANPSLYEELNTNSNFCGTGNCIKDCQDTNQLFNGTSPAPFGVCMLFANISRTLPNRAIWNDQQALELTSFGFTEQSDASFEAIANAVTTCLTDACKENPNAKHCKQSCSSVGLLVNSSTPSFGGVSDCLQQVCSQDLMFADFDLAGIGVTISYFLQIVIAIFGIAYLLFMQKRSKKKNVQNRHRQSREDRKDEFFTSLVEFHKAQCFFVVAVQIAALTLMQKPDQTSQANMAAIPVTAAIGIQAPLFAYLVIAKYGRHSSYLLLLTVAAWILSSVTMWNAYTILYINQNVSYQLPAQPSCGNHDLSYFCYSLRIYTGLSSDSRSLDYNLSIWFIVWIAIWSVSILVLLSAITSWVQLTKFPRLKPLRAFFISKSGRFANIRFGRRKWWKPWRYLDPEAEKDVWLFYVITAFLAASLCMELYQLAYIWKLNLESAGNWTFGQIVAVLVWAAPLAEFVNVTINGIVDGSNFRFARSLTVARVPKSGPASELTPVVQQRQNADGEAGMQLIQPIVDDSMSAHRWSQQTAREMADYESEMGIVSPETYP